MRKERLVGLDAEGAKREVLIRHDIAAIKDPNEVEEEPANKGKRKMLERVIESAKRPHEDVAHALSAKPESKEESPISKKSDETLLAELKHAVKSAKGHKGRIRLYYKVYADELRRRGWAENSIAATFTEIAVLGQSGK